MSDPAGPIYLGGFQTVGAGGTGYQILFLADKHNDALQREGKAPVYYWMPSAVRIARNGTTNDYKFRLIHFVGVRSGETTVGVAAGQTQEIAGGVLSVTTTAAIPPDALQAAYDELLKRFKGNNDRYWGWRTPAAPMFRPMPIMENYTTISNLSPNANGQVPAAGGQPGNIGRAVTSGEPRTPVLSASPQGVVSPRSLRLDRDTNQLSNLDPWYVNMQGQGPGSIDPSGENAYTALLGTLPTAILWNGFHGAYSPVAVAQALKLKVWAPSGKMTITADWDKAYDFFSAAGHAGGWFWGVDIQASYTSLRASGGIDVKIEVDTTLPNADKLNELLSKQADLITNKFMEQAQKMIFDPKPPEDKPAEAPSGFFGWGGGFALKANFQRTGLRQRYDYQLDVAYLQQHVISSTLEGFYNEIKADPSAERKYFATINLEDWDRAVQHIIKPVVNYADPARQWIGEPVSFLSVDVGYPSQEGDIQWQGHTFQSTDPAGSTWQPKWSKKSLQDVANPPSGWTPDMTFVKRRVHFSEPPDPLIYPYSQVQVEKDQVDLDEGPNGTLTNDVTLEVRADSAGKLSVGPISLDAVLENANQEIVLSLQALGRTAEGKNRDIAKFRFTYGDQDQPRYFSVYTGQKNFDLRYRYQVEVVVRGSIFSKGLHWTGPWVEMGGNGPFVGSVPTPDDPGVTKRNLIAAAEPTTTPADGVTPGTNGDGLGALPTTERPATGGLGAPPATATRSKDRSVGASGTAGGYGTRSRGRSTGDGAPAADRSPTAAELLPELAGAGSGSDGRG